MVKRCIYQSKSRQMSNLGGKCIRMKVGIENCSRWKWVGCIEENSIEQKLEGGQWTERILG